MSKMSTVAILKIFNSRTVNRIESNVYGGVGVGGGGGGEFYMNGLGHMTKMAATSMYGINLKRSSTAGLIAMKFGM